MKINEIKGNSHVFTLKDKTTFRIFAHEVREVDDALISDEMKIAEKMGFILMTPSPKVIEPATKKSGGEK